MGEGVIKAKSYGIEDYVWLFIIENFRIIVFKKDRFDLFFTKKFINMI